MMMLDHRAAQELRNPGDELWEVFDTTYHFPSQIFSGDFEPISWKSSRMFDEK
jgi:hypothetical protein